MKIPLPYFLMTCLLLGAVILPTVWRQRRQVRAVQLKREVGALRRSLAYHYDSAARRSNCIEAVENQIENMTGERPSDYPYYPDEVVRRDR